jgi:hypothetical protein
MKAPRIAKAILLGAVIALLSCGGPSRVTGKSGEWIRGKALSLKATFTNGDVVLEFRNESAKDIDLTPFRLTVWGKRTGQQELRLSTERSRSSTNLKWWQTDGVVGLMLIVNAGGMKRKLAPHESTEWPALGTVDANKIRLVVGPEESKEQEIFTVSF